MYAHNIWEKNLCRTDKIDAAEAEECRPNLISAASLVESRVWEDQFSKKYLRKSI